MDVTKDDEVFAARETVERYLHKTAGNGLHAVVNNAGVTGAMVMDDWLTPDDYHFALDVNTYGTIRVTQAFKSLVKRTGGRIVATSSVMGRTAIPGTGPYAVSKYAIEGYCDVIRQELRDFGVGVCLLETGGFRTPMTEPSRVAAIMRGAWDRTPTEVKEEYGQDYCERAVKMICEEMLPRASTDTSQVVDAYWSAMMDENPSARYAVGWDAKLFFIPLSIFPTAVVDFVVATLFRLIKLPKPAAAVQQDK